MYSRDANPRRALTQPSVGVKNDGLDNENTDLIMYVNDALVNCRPGLTKTYVVQEMLGQGTFGQVVLCVCQETGKHVAVKVIKNQPAYYHQARVEIGLLYLLNSRFDPDDQHNLVRMEDYFLYQQHLCLVSALRLWAGRAHAGPACLPTQRACPNIVHAVHVMCVIVL